MFQEVTRVIEKEEVTRVIEKEEVTRVIEKIICSKKFKE